MKIGYFAAGLMCCAGDLAVAAVPAAVDGTITIDGVVEATDSADAAALASASAIVLNSGSKDAKEMRAKRKAFKKDPNKPHTGNAINTEDLMK